MYLGIIIGAITGRVSGVLIGANVFNLTLVGGAFGAPIGLVSGLAVGALAGTVDSPEKNKRLGRKISQVLLVGFPLVITALAIATITTTPIHGYLLRDYILPILSHPPNVPEKQVQLPDGYVNVFHFSDRVKPITANNQKDFFRDVIWLIPLILLMLGSIRDVLERKSFITSLKNILAIIFFGVVLVYQIRGTIKSRQGRDTSLRRAYQEYQTIFQYQQYQIVEGPVKVLHRYPPGGHDAGDIIVIDDLEFEISPYLNALFYDKPIVDGGILTPNRQVRVYYYDDKILAIDLKPNSK